MGSQSEFPNVVQGIKVIFGIHDATFEATISWNIAIRVFLGLDLLTDMRKR